MRAVLEGVAYNSRWLHEAVEKFVKRRLDHVRFIGGGAQSDLWCQIHADVLDRTIERVADPVDANLRGAALLAGLALGAVRQDEVRDLVHGRRDASGPTTRNRATYDRLYAEFPKLYKAQKGMFNRLNQPTQDRTAGAHRPHAVWRSRSGDLRKQSSERLRRAATFFSRSM